MKKQWKGFLAGILFSLFALGIGTTAFAAYQRQATLNYSDIKISIDGIEIIPKDANGKAVEPFTIDGTTYLPVRAIGEALGLEVVWDKVMNTILLFTKEGGYIASASTEPKQPDVQVSKNTDIEPIGAKISNYLGAPIFGLKVKNNTNQDIIRFDMYINCYDAYGNRIDGFYSSIYSDKILKAGEEAERSWDLLGSQGVYKVAVGVYKYCTADGDVVEIPDAEILWKSITHKS